MDNKELINALKGIYQNIVECRQYYATFANATSPIAAKIKADLTQTFEQASQEIVGVLLEIAYGSREFLEIAEQIIIASEAPQEAPVAEATPIEEMVAAAEEAQEEIKEEEAPIEAPVEG